VVVGDLESGRDQSAVPMVSYEDVGRAIEWLTRAFGFHERGPRYTEPDGRVTHAEMERDGAVVMLGWPGPEYRGPARHAEACAIERAVSARPFVADGVLVCIDDVDRHADRARSAGATIVREPEDQEYGRLYVAADLEGHRWMFVSSPRSP
jgi:uncharacterized glyoxalase superfamily protein PhnB